MREIVFDTETTGFEATKGDRLVEIGAVELFNHLPTGRIFHKYINPERDVPQDAVNVHGLTEAFLRDKPLFADVVDEWMEFIGTDAKLIAHNARFDFGFMNAELARAKRPLLAWDRMIDSLQLARDKIPNARHTLDALCQRFRIDNSNRTLHGALLDSELLAEVYLELIGGRQRGFDLASAEKATPDASAAITTAPTTAAKRPAPLPPRLTEAELEAHRALIAKMGDKAIWARYLGNAAD